MKTINISKDYTNIPGPRFARQGAFSGEEFRRKILLPAFKKARENKEMLEVVLDGTYGYFDSFLEESFGGLARELNDNSIFECFRFVSIENPTLPSKIKDFIDKAIK